MKKNIQIITLALLLVFQYNFTIAAKYYFSTSGDDSRSAAQAQNSSTPWKSINKLNAVFASLKPGDEVLFKRGETFYGAIHINASGAQGRPITIGAYGSGDKPIITSLVTLGNWTNVGNGVYESHHPSFGNEVNVVLINNNVQEMGRYPNRNASNNGYLIFQATNGLNNIVSNGLSGNWSGGELVIRKSHWTIDRYKNISHLGNVINFVKTAGNYNPVKGYGFFIQGHPGSLDQEGEWYYNPSSKKLRVFFGSSQPSSKKVEASTFDNLVTNDHHKGHIVFDNIDFKGANKSAFKIVRSNDFHIFNSVIENSGENGADFENTPNIKIENTHVLNSYNNGLYLRGNTANAIIKNNKIENTNVFPGHGKSGIGNGVGISTGSDNNLIEYNEVVNTGYIGIRFGGNGTVVKNNVVDTFCLIKDDGAGIYTWTGSSNQEFHGRKIQGNIILNGVGAIEGTPTTSSQVEGIYLDDNSSGLEITGNTVGNVKGKGILIHNARNIVVKNNTFYNNGVQLRISHDNLGHPIRNATVSDNIFFSKTADQMTAFISSIKDDIKDMGSFDRNFYARPVDDFLSIFTQHQEWGQRISKTYDLEDWTKEYNKDQSSKKSPVKLPSHRIINVDKSNKFPNGTFDNQSMASKGIHKVNASLSWSSGGNLDGGSLQVKSNGRSSITLTSSSSREVDYYVLRFNAVASKPTLIKAFLIQTNHPWAEISSKVTLKLDTKKGEYEAVIPMTKKDGKVSIRLESETNDLTYWLDNLTLNEAQAEPINVDQYVQFAYNTTKKAKEIVLDGTYVDVNNTSYSGKVSLSPFSSKVLIKTSNVSSPPEKSNEAPNVTIVSPSSNESFQEFSKIKIVAEAVDGDGTIKQVDFYNGSKVIGTVTSPPYEFVWENVPKGEHTITAKATDNLSLTASSEQVNAKVLASSGVGEVPKDEVATPPSSDNGSFKLFLNAGSNESAVYDGHTFQGDLKFPSYYSSSVTFSNAKASNEKLLQTERNADVLKYSIPVPNGTYSIKTYHNELWFGKGGPVAAKNSRVFHISLEGEMVKEDFENSNNEDDNFLVFNNIEVSDGVLNLDLVASKNKASISGIAIIQGGETPDEVKPPFLGDQDSDAIYLNTGSPVNVEYQGNLFLGDQNFVKYFNSPYTFTNRSASQEALFQTERLSALDKTSSLKYSIPVPNGTYIVKTYHNELWFGKLGPSAAAGRRVFDILIEGEVVKEKHDKFVASSNQEAVMTFTDIVVKDGILNLDLIAHKDRASISGIAIIPENSSASQKVVPTTFYSAYYNIGAPATVDYEGDTFVGEGSVDTYHNASHTQVLPRASNEPLFQSERNALALNYKVPVPNGTYTVETYHNELWWGGNGPSAASGRRVFSISLEGQVVKKDFDIFAENKNQPTKLTFESVVVEDGILNLEMMASKDRATISGLAIFGESVQTTPSGANLRTLSTAEDALLTEEAVDTGLGAEIIMYPNPASQSTKISVNHEIGLENILIHNMNGQLIQHLDPNLLKDGAGGFVISLDGIPQGIYLVSLVGRTKMIKQLRLIVKP